MSVRQPSPDTAAKKLDQKILKVVASDACSGCGLCTIIDPGLDMALDEQGFMRPERSAIGHTPTNATHIFKRSCPGMLVRSNDEPGLERHETMGSFVGVWKGHATDPETRHRGSSAGVLTALTTWLLESGKATRVAGAGAGRDPRRTVPVSITTKEEALASAGSRYAPTAILSNPDIQLPGTAVVGKPCEISALRSYVSNSRLDGMRTPAPVLLSFFCAGTPSAHATQRLIESLGIAKGTTPDSLWYRGRGWPGRFTVKLRDMTRSMSYDESWGKVLGPATQWRCKVCPDGVGESADIAVADFWESDESGYPIFNEAKGASAVIARTIRGKNILMEAASEGIIELEPIDIDSLADVQPLQVQRRSGLLARLTGSIIAGRRIPRFAGFGLTKMARRQPRLFIRVTRGTYRRVRTAKR